MLRKIANHQKNILLFHIPAERYDHNALMISFAPGYLERAYWFGSIFPSSRSHVQICDPDPGAETCR
jgi:hypothetical protein